MAVKQLSIFLENRQGQMADVIKQIADADINIRAMSVADSKDFGILRLLVSDTDKAKEILGDEAIVRVTDVIAVRMNDIQGALYTILNTLDEAQINVDYAYASQTHDENTAYSVFRVDDVAAAEAALSRRGFAFISEANL